MLNVRAPGADTIAIASLDDDNSDRITTTAPPVDHRG
jgi:hypothetical protein